MSGEIVASKKLLKILCLHGCNQNKDIFRSKIGSLRKCLSKCAELFFVEAPHDIVRPGSIVVGGKSWWFTSESREYVSKEVSQIDIGFRESVDLVQKFVEDEGPFDGLMGYSQGASLAGLICFMIENQQFKGDFKFVILVSGFKSRCIPHENYYNSVSTIPSLHIIGDTDEIIAKERSDELSELFKDPTIFRHPGGHYVPAMREAKQHYIDFLSRFFK